MFNGACVVVSAINALESLRHTGIEDRHQNEDRNIGRGKAKQKSPPSAAFAKGGEGELIRRRRSGRYQPQLGVPWQLPKPLSLYLPLAFGAGNVGPLLKAAGPASADS